MTIKVERKRQDLTKRTKTFARRTRDFVRCLPPSPVTCEYGKQLLRAAGSVAANYNEAFYSFGLRDFVYRIKLTRKESNESLIWLDLLDIGLEESLEQERHWLLNEATELMKIFTAIAKKIDPHRPS